MFLETLESQYFLSYGFSVVTTRTYRLGRRLESASETRERIVAAARSLIATPDGVRPFSIDAVARRARVARTTVYHQFGTRAALLEELFDHVGMRGPLRAQLAEAYALQDAHAVLRAYIAAFGAFWESDRVVIRCIEAMAALDPELGRAIYVRRTLRREEGRVVVQRLCAAFGGGNTDSPALTQALTGCAAHEEERVTILFTLTSFVTFDAMAGEASLETVVPAIQDMARRLLIP